MNLLVERYSSGKPSYALVQPVEYLNVFEIDFYTKHVSIFVYDGMYTHKTDILHKMTDEELLNLTREAYCTTTEEDL